MTKATKISLAVIGALVLSLLGGYLGAGMRGGDSAAAGDTSSGSWVKNIQESGELRVGVAIAPPMTSEVDGKLGGPNLIPLQNLADELDVKLVTVSATWNNIVAGLQANRYDAAAYLDQTLERAKAIQFSDPVYEYDGVFVVKADSSYLTGEDVIKSGKKVASAAGAATADAVQAAGAKLLELTDYTNALQALKADRAVAVFTDLPTAQSQAQADPSVKIIVPEPSIYRAASNYGLSADIDPWSLNFINIAIHNALISGEFDRAIADVGLLPIDQLGDLEKK